MKRSRDRFLTTHTGSLPRPEDLIRMMFAKEEGIPVEPRALAMRIRDAVADIVQRQTAAGIDIVNDGEMSKPSYATYIKDRLNGFGGESQPPPYPDLVPFPGLHQKVYGDRGRARRKMPGCNAPISVRDREAVKVDIENLKAGVAGRARRPLHERRVARRRVALLPQRLLQDARGISLRDRRRDAVPSTKRSPTPASCCSSIAPTSAWGGTSNLPISRSRSFARRRGCTSRR